MADTNPRGAVAVLDEQLRVISETVTNTIADQHRAHCEVVQRLTALETQIQRLSRDIADLCKVVRDGNGQPSIIHRLSHTETQVLAQAEKIEELQEYANSIIASRMLTKSQMVVGASGMLLTVAISTAALIATLIKP